MPPERSDCVTGPAALQRGFRQTFRAFSAETIETALLRETKEGWTPTFPGSDRLLMKRRGSGSRAG
jgi:hypothetical protein